ncbi:hypothetical protein, partial [Klebsiella pneumoniae]|uniref:hypothetical protein n=1 Tax=Klebsiella pneumoniae TaxID=573 RepID=UPI001EEDBB4B
MTLSVNSEFFPHCLLAVLFFYLSFSPPLHCRRDRAKITARIDCHSDQITVMTFAFAPDSFRRQFPALQDNA